MSKFSSLLKKWSDSSLVLRIVVGLVIGAVLGLVCPQWTGIGILGQVFVSALKAIAPVLVALLVASSIAKAKGGLGPRFRTVIILYLVSTLCAAIFAVVASFLFPVTIKLQGSEAGGSAPGGLSDVFLTLLTNMVMNPVQALAQANYIGILFWAIILGLGLKMLASEHTIHVVGDLADVVSQVVRWVIQFAPFGILGLVFSSVSESGLVIFTDYGKLLLLLVGCMCCTAFIVNPFIACLHIRKNPYPLYWKCLKESGLNAFFTRSSAANIPINMDLCKRLGLDEEFYSVSIPLGSTVNMNGAAVTITVLSLAVAHTVGVEVRRLRRLRGGRRLPPPRPDGLLLLRHRQRHRHAGGRCRLYHRRRPGLRRNRPQLILRCLLHRRRRIPRPAEKRKPAVGLPPVLG